MRLLSRPRFRPWSRVVMRVCVGVSLGVSLGLDGCEVRLCDVIRPRVVDGGVTATGVLSRERGNLITVCITLY